MEGSARLKMTYGDGGPEIGKVAFVAAAADPDAEKEEEERVLVFPGRQKANRRDPEALQELDAMWRRYASTHRHCEITYGGRTYPSVANAYQAAKLSHLRIGPPGAIEKSFKRLQSCSGREAERWGTREGFEDQSLVLDLEAWHSARRGIMYALMSQRLSFDIKLRRILEASRPYRLVHSTPARSGFWSAWKTKEGVLVGKNELGQIFEELREALPAETGRWAKPKAPSMTTRTPSSAVTYGVWSTFVALVRWVEGTPQVLVCSPKEWLGYRGEIGTGDMGWHLPGGKVEPGEIGDLFTIIGEPDTGAREFLEEIGVGLPKVRRVECGYVLKDPRNPRNNVRLCAATLAEEGWTPPESSEEMGAIRWLDAQRLIDGGKDVRGIARMLSRSFLGTYLGL